MYIYIYIYIYICFFRINIYTYLSKFEIILLTICPNLLSYKALSGNNIYEMKVCLNNDGVFKLFEIVVLANFHNKYSQKSKKKLLYFYCFFFFKKKTMAQCLKTPCIKYFNIMVFMQSRLKELQLLSF